LLGLPADRRPTEWQSGLRAAKASGVDPDHVLAILRHYTEHGRAYSAGALYRRLQRCHPQLPPSESWPQPSPSATGPTPQSRDLAIRQRVEGIEFRTIRAGRAAQLADLAIRERIETAMRAEGLPPELSRWGCETPSSEGVVDRSQAGPLDRPSDWSAESRNRNVEAPVFQRLPAEDSVKVTESETNDRRNEWLNAAGSN